MGGPLLQAIGLSVEIGGNVVLNDVNLEISKNEVHVLMGFNASGKTTLLRTIAGDPRCKVVDGRILFEGKDITNLKPFERARLGIALAFQSPPKIPSRTSYVFEKLMSKYGFERERLVRYQEALRASHLMSRALFHGFSGGEVKRVELLMVVVQRPKLALLDEPDSGVDVDSLAMIARLINELVDQGSAVLLVTHFGHVLRHLKRVDRLHVMHNGRIVYSGSPEVIHEILDHGYEKFLKRVGAI